MPTKHTVEMDCAPETDADHELILADAAKHRVTAAMVNPCGPGGGNPVYAFTGTMEDLRAYLKAHHNPGLEGEDLEQELDFYLERAQPVN